MRFTKLGTAKVTALAALGAVLVLGAPPSAYAKSVTHKDDARGFRVKVPDSYDQVPPKLTEADAHIAAEWQDLRPKYVRNSADKPSFKIIWTVKAKGEAPVEEEKEPEGLSDMEKLLRKMMRGQSKTLADEANQYLKWYARLFGEYKPIEERWEDPKAVKKVKTTSKHEVEYIEINYPGRGVPKSTANKSVWYMLVAKTKLDFPDREVDLGFVAYCDNVFAKKLKTEWLRVIKSFDLREAEDPLDEDKTSITDETDPAVFRERVKQEKLIKGWKALDTENYLILYDEEVDAKKIVRRVAVEIEAIREQVYEVLFPPDRPILDVSVVRICKNREQYSSYGGPGGSAGYWAAYEKELVFYEDQNNKDNSVAVLYHEAFHQYIYYSVGDLAPHSWFNEGHGDYFAGFEYKGGKFHKKEFNWRKDLAKKLKRDGKAPPLDDWLFWSQAQYYGRNDKGLDGGANYALGWDFVWFLRTTKNEQYARILPRYFDILKGFATAGREAADKALEDTLKGKEDEGGEPEDGEPEGGEGDAPPPPATAEEGTTTDIVPRHKWKEQATKSALEGIDLEQLYKDWMADKTK